MTRQKFSPWSMVQPIWIVVCALFLNLGSADRIDASESDELAWFESKVRPLLAERCYKCHGDAKQEGGLRLDSRSGWLQGGDSGAAIVPGNPDASLIIQAVRYADQTLEMPPTGKLPPAEIAALERWVKSGAPDPRVNPPGESAAAASPRKSWPEIFESRKQWWNLQPVRAITPPQVDDSAWSHTTVDAFLRKRMSDDGLEPSAVADPRTLIRRASLVLTGLPPAPREVEAFVEAAARNPSAAFESLVDRLLESPHYGERFARHWLDVVRFSETSGCDFNYDVPFAWRYRDYVVRAFNGDLPYDQFVREQIAGDLLSRPRWNVTDRFNESAIGTAFYRFGEVNQENCVEFPVVGYDIADGQIDTLTKAFQASTVACARCHDHKLDAISTKDYYAILGIVRSSRSVQRTLDAPDVNREPMAELADLKRQLRRELAEVWRTDVHAIKATALSQLAAARTAPAADITDPLYAWQGAFAEQPSAEGWRVATAEQAKEATARREFNRQKFTTLADFRNGSFNAWANDGMGLRDGASKAGDFVIAREGDSAISAVLPAGVFTFALSDKLNGALRSPTLRRTHANVSFEIVGGHNSLARLVFNNCQLGGYAKSLHHKDWSWVTVSFPGNSDQLLPYAELVTFWDNPKFPEPQGDGSDKDSGNQRGTWSEHAGDLRTWWGLRRVMLHNGNEPPKDELNYLTRLSTGAAPATVDEAAARYVQIAEQAVADFAADRVTDDDVRWLDWLLKNRLISNRAEATPTIAALIARYRDVERNQIRSPRTMSGVADEGDGFEQPLLVRGDLSKPAEPIERRYLEALAGHEYSFDRKGSGRRAIADAIASPTNPLTARVMVNRVWQWVFGAGLVRTPDDFGHLGEAPTHPELLDHLAYQFQHEGWSVKKLVRRLLLTRAFQSVAAPTPAAKQRDPLNLALSHYSARRGEAEVIRDSILAVSGRLDPALGGPSIPPFREKTDRAMRLFAGPLDGDGRRSIYIKVQLIEGPRFLSAFNVPGGKVTQGRRDSSNVPAQSLALLNDPFVLAMADVWAKHLGSDGARDAGARIDRMYQTALGRPPSDIERRRFMVAIESFARLHNVPQSELLASRIVWRDAAHALFNFQEFLYIP